ncbi:hypothetical protein ABZV41_42650 [Streptomyces sp. NPDC005098]
MALIEKLSNSALGVPICDLQKHFCEMRERRVTAITIQALFCLPERGNY